MGRVNIWAYEIIEGGHMRKSFINLAVISRGMNVDTVSLSTMLSAGYNSSQGLINASPTKLLF